MMPPPGFERAAAQQGKGPGAPEGYVITACCRWPSVVNGRGLSSGLQPRVVGPLEGREKFFWFFGEEGLTGPEKALIRFAKCKRYP